MLLYIHLDNGCFRWSKNETEARLLTEQEFRWLLEGMEIEQPKAIKESKPCVLNADIPSPVFKKTLIPAPMIPHIFCSPELLAHIFYEKYAMAVPLEG